MEGRPAKRSLGQNFLVDPNTQRRIVDALDLTGAQRIVEIGPGRGALTEWLIQTGLPLVVIEKDHELAQRWAERAMEVDVLTVVHADATTVPLDRFGPPSETVVIGNIPYNITTPLLFHLLERPRPRDVVVMVQREVADRIVATPGTAQYGALSVGLQLVARVEKLFGVPRTVFKPRPRVDSAVVRITPHAPPMLTEADERRTREVVRACFGWRRKQLGTTLRKHGDLRVEAERVSGVLADLGIAPQTRAEMLTPGQFVALGRAL